MSSDGIFDETRFSSISRPKDLQVSTNIQEVDDDQLQSQDFPSNSVDDETRLSFDFNVNEADKCVYSKFDDKGHGVIICLYVDDILVIGTSIEQVEMTKESLSLSFSMKELGEVNIILGIKIINHNGGLMLNQSHYIEKILKRFVFEKAPISTQMDACTKLIKVKLFLNWNIQRS